MSSKAVILLVEDQRGFRRIYQDALSAAGYDVLTAEDGQIGWNLAQEKKPDLVLLDLGLPKLNGFEVLEKIRSNAETEDIAVIIFSVIGEQADIDHAMALGANDYTIKGFNTPKQVLEKIDAFLAARKTSPAT